LRSLQKWSNYAGNNTTHGRRYCYGFCRPEKLQLVAKTLGLSVEDKLVGKRTYETRLKIAVNTVELEKLLQKMLS